MPAYAPMLEVTHYALNYAGIIRQSLRNYVDVPASPSQSYSFWSHHLSQVDAGGRVV